MTWILDKQHVDLSFSAKHMMVATVKGRFADVEAEVEIDEERPEVSRVKAVAAVQSLTTGNPERDAHLKSVDFLNATEHPILTFESTQVRPVGDGRFELTGNLTIRDTTRLVVLSGEFTGPVKSPWGDRRIGFALDGEIDREDFGLTWNVALETGGVLVSRKIKLHVDAEVAEAAALAA